MLRYVTYGHVVFGRKENMHPLKGFIHLCNGNRTMQHPLRDVDNSGGVHYMFFSLLPKMYLDFGVEIIVILGITPEDEEDFIGIVDVGGVGE